VLALQISRRCNGGKLKKYLVLLICSSLLIGTAAAEAPTSKGQRLGLWCSGIHQARFLYDGQPLAATTSCSLYGSGAPSGSYRKLADRRWQRLTSDGIPAEPLVFLAAGTLETLSANALADVTDAKTKVVVQSPALDGLVRGGQIEWKSGSWKGISLKDKRVAIVLSSQTVSELERFKRERQTLIEASASIRDQRVQTARTKFIVASNPDRLLAIVVKVFRKYVKEVQPVDDFTALKKGGFDYALVVHWKSFTRFDLLGKYDSFPEGDYSDWERGTTPAVMGSWLTGILINADLQAVQIYSFNRPHVSTKYISPYEKKGVRDDSQGASDYIAKLASGFESDWGESVDDLGGTGRALDFEMKGFR